MVIGIPDPGRPVAAAGENVATIGREDHTLNDTRVVENGEGVGDRIAGIPECSSVPP